MKKLSMQVSNPASYNKFNCVAVAYKRNYSMNVIENSTGEPNGNPYFASYVMLTSGERFANVSLSPLFLSSLSGAEGKVYVCITRKNKKTITRTRAGVTDVANLFLLVSAPPLLWHNYKGAEMSCFKEGEKWRWNEPSKVIQYFGCNMKVLANGVGLNATEISTILDKSIPVVSNWMNGRDMPPSDIQEMIAQLVGAKSRAEVWPYKGEDITKYRIHLNKLHREEEKIKNLIQKKLKREV